MATVTEIGSLISRHPEIRGGRPCIVRIANTTLSFRDGELVSVLVAVRKSA